MPKKKMITKKEIQSSLNTLSLNDFLSLVDGYSKSNGVDLDSVKSKLITDDLQNRLINNGINTTCPYCNSSNKISFGKNGNVKRFKCKDCNKTFTPFTNTILEKTKIHWDIWVKVVQLVILNTPVEKIQKILIKDYGLSDLNYRSVFLWKHKIIHALAQMPMPKLSGIIQVDETFFRESQKGSRELESTIKGEIRLPRYGYRPSKYGVMGSEFANVVCMVDLKGYVVAKVIGLGKLTKEVFTSEFDDYIENPIYICSDGNSVYKDYCTIKNIPLYIKPSNYIDTIQKNGYIQLDPTSPTYQKDYEKNQKVLEKLYNEHLIDYIYNMDMPYEDFYYIKNDNSLGLSRVNQFHSELKRFLVYNSKSVSTKYLKDYIGFMVYVRNWSITNGGSPSTLEDAEKILIDILKRKTTYRTSDLENAKLELPKVSDKYMALLKEKTKEARKITKNPYFKYDEEDNVISFDKRTYLNEIPAYKLNELRKHYKISSKWAKYAIISELLKKKDIDEQILLLINEDKHTKISQEDKDFLAASAYRSVV